MGAAQPVCRPFQIVTNRFYALGKRLSESSQRINETSLLRCVTWLSVSGDSSRRRNARNSHCSRGRTSLPR